MSNLKSSILIVDDIIANIDVLKAILMEDYNLKAATKGIVALKIAEKFLPDIILLDIMMPGMDGYDVCEKLKENPITSHIPIIFVTAMHEVKDEAKGFKVGAVDFITKPINPVVVKARIKTHIALSNQQKELDIQVREKTADLEQSRIDLVSRLSSAAEFKDKDTGLHIRRMSMISQIVAKEYGLSSKEVELISLATPMHDVGKIGIEDKILQKAGKLTDKEWTKMKKHCDIGVKILGHPKDELLRAASIIAHQHHEKWNGKGYPDGLRKENIHIYARIAAIADVFDALTSDRPYKKAWKFEDALNLIKEEKGKHFDPQVVEAFLNKYDEIVEICKLSRE